jgi:DNA-directed RNA polymerase subunit L
MIGKLQNLNSVIEKDEIEIKIAESTIQNCYDIKLDNEDYTIGKVIEYFMLSSFYEKGILTYCGFKMLHPHDTYSLIRVAYKEPIVIDNIKNDLKTCIQYSVDTFTKIRKEFLKLVPR